MELHAKQTWANSVDIVCVATIIYLAFYNVSCVTN